MATELTAGKLGPVGDTPPFGFDFERHRRVLPATVRFYIQAVRDVQAGVPRPDQWLPRLKERLGYDHTVPLHPDVRKLSYLNFSLIKILERSSVRLPGDNDGVWRAAERLSHALANADDAEPDHRDDELERQTTRQAQTMHAGLAPSRPDVVDHAVGGDPSNTEDTMGGVPSSGTECRPIHQNCGDGLSEDHHGGRTSVKKSSCSFSRLIQDGSPDQTELSNRFTEENTRVMHTYQETSRLEAESALGGIPSNAKDTLGGVSSGRPECRPTRRLSTGDDASHSEERAETTVDEGKLCECQTWQIDARTTAVSTIDRPLSLARVLLVPWDPGDLYPNTTLECKE